MSSARLILSSPPDPKDPRFKDVDVWRSEVYRVLLDWRGKLEQQSRALGAPTGPMAVPTAFSTNTTATGTMTGTDVANVVCTLVQELINTSVLTPNLSRTS
jgi:hypothetical protein